MKDDLKGKRLLLLNGLYLACDLIEKARELGVYTIVTDWYKDAPAKRISDEHYLVSIADIDAVVELAKKVGADGVITQYVDSSLPHCLKVCEKLNFPFFLNAQQLETISNKELSKEACIKYGIPVSERYYVTDESSDEELSALKFPVLTKPVDNSGQRGISICNDVAEFKKGYQYAKENSESGKVLVEEYMRGDYLAICFTLQDGKLSLSCLADKPVVTEELAHGNIRLPKGYVMPSKYLDLFYEKAFKKFENMARGLGLKNGSWGIECVCRNNDFYVFEMQFRLGGMKHHNFVLQENGIDLLEMHIRYALTGSFSGYDLNKDDTPYYKKTYCSLNVLLGKGVISSIRGLDEIRNLPGVINTTMMHKLGDKVEDTGTVFQILVKFSLEVNNKQELGALIKKIYERLVVLDENGNNMLLDVWSEDDLNNL